MSTPKVLFSFHAVWGAPETAPQSIIEIYYEPTRRDARMRQFLQRPRGRGALIEADGLRIAKLAGSQGHRGVAARVQPGTNAVASMICSIAQKPMACVIRCCWCLMA